MFCRSLFVLLYFSFWPLCCLFFFDIRILINPLVSSNSFYLKNALSKFFLCRNVLENGGKQTHHVQNSKCFWWSGKYVIFRRKEDANFFSNTICTIVLFVIKIVSSIIIRKKLNIILEVPIFETSREWGKNRKVLTTSGTYPLS